MRPEMKINGKQIMFHHEKNSDYVSCHCERNKINFFFVLVF